MRVFLHEGKGSEIFLKAVLAPEFFTDQRVVVFLSGELR